jgi:hypothetical protein
MRRRDFIAAMLGGARLHGRSPRLVRNSREYQWSAAFTARQQQNGRPPWRDFAVDWAKWASLRAVTSSLNIAERRVKSIGWPKWQPIWLAVTSQSS